MPLNDLHVIDPRSDDAYDTWVGSRRASTVFHSSAWARLLAESYRFRPAYLLLNRAWEVAACLPLMEVDSLITGRRGVSLCFSDSCGAVADGQEEFQALLQAALAHGRKRKWRYLEFRGERFLEGEVASSCFVNHTLALCRDTDEMLARVRKSTARGIRKALKEGVRVQFHQDLEGVLTYYKLHCLTRKRQGVPPQPRSYFVNLHRHLIGRGLGFAVLAYHAGIAVAGAICLHYGSNAIYKYGASDERYQSLRANNLLFWEMITRCAQSGFDSLSLGRTDPDNSGLIHFKDGWGGVRSELRYHRYDLRAGGFCGPGAEGWNYSALLKKLPGGMLRALGELGYRHMG